MVVLGELQRVTIIHPLDHHLTLEVAELMAESPGYNSKTTEPTDL
jgi:hypothetical protein